MKPKLKLFFLIITCFFVSCEEGFDPESGITLSENNEVYTLELNVSNNVTDDLSPIQFNARVIRNTQYSVRSDSRLIGYWLVYSLTIDSVISNIAQFPTFYEFFSNQSYSKIEESTVGGDDVYSGGVWIFDNALNQLSLIMLGDTTVCTVSFDYDGSVVPLDGFMIWDYEKDGHVYHNVLQKAQETDSDQFLEPSSFLTISSAGGEIAGISEPNTVDIPILLSNEVNATYEVSGTFVPLLDFSEGNLLSTLFSDTYTIININIPILIEITTD